MELKRLMLAVALGGALAAPALAEDSDVLAQVEPLLDPRVMLGGLVTEGDVSALFAQLRAAMLAAAEGREPPPLPEAMGKRLEAIGGQLQLRGLVVGLALSHVMERAARDAVRELAPPHRGDF